MSATNMLKRGYELLASRDLQEADRIAQALLSEGDTPVALALASEVASACMNHDDAIRHAERAFALEPNNVSREVLLARTYFTAGRLEDARKLAVSLAGKSVTDFVHLQIVGTLLVHVEEHDLAYDVFLKAVAAEPQKAEGQRNLAMTCRALGRLKEAEEVADVALKLNPLDSETLLMRSSLRRQTLENNHIAELSSSLSKFGKDWRGSVKALYALGKELEDVGAYDKSFEAIHQGAALRHQHTRYDVNDDAEIFDALIQTFTPDVFENASPGYDNNEPIFILGMPRTGSTLLERILGSQKDVYAAGELGHFAAAMMEQASVGAQNRQQLVGNSAKIDMEALGRRYIELTRLMTGQTPRFIDKLPLNFLYIGLIAAALPGAKIVHVTRSPLDACFAMYKFHFNKAYPFSYDLNDLATYYTGYRRLMAHWHAVLPGRIIDVSYEGLVDAPEDVAQDLMEALELDWDPACLDFHKNKAASTTGSASQIRQPIYASSVGSWRSYEKELQPLRVALENSGINPITY